MENAARLGDHALTRLDEMKGKHSAIGDVRGRGFLIGIDLVKDRDSKEPAEDLAEDVFYRCLDKGLSFKITMGHVLTLTPPLILTREEMDLALNIIDEALAGSGRLARRPMIRQDV